MNSMVKIALRFRSDLLPLIEQNRRRSRATLRILRLKRRQRWPEDEIQDDHVICLQLLSLMETTIILSDNLLITFSTKT